MTLQITLLQYDDSCYDYVDANQYHLASFSTRNSTLILRFVDQSECEIIFNCAIPLDIFMIQFRRNAEYFFQTSMIVYQILNRSTVFQQTLVDYFVICYLFHAFQMENLVLVLTISLVDRSNYASTDCHFFYRLAKIFGL